MARRMAFTSFRFDPATGEYIRQELYGPPDYPAWWKSWVVLRTALVLLNEVRHQPLEMYGDIHHKSRRDLRVAVLVAHLRRRRPRAL